jgi:hypothetical protein
VTLDLYLESLFSPVSSGDHGEYTWPFAFFKREDVSKNQEKCWISPQGKGKNDCLEPVLGGTKI